MIGCLSVSLWPVQPDLVSEAERSSAERSFKQVSQAYAQLTGRESFLSHGFTEGIVSD